MLSGLGFLSMRLSFVFKLGLAVTALVVLLTALMFALGKNRMHAARTVSAAESNGRQLPPLVLWAWEQPIDLSFIDPDRVGVAVLARTIRLRLNEVIIQPRLQPLKLPDTATVIAVARVESDRRYKPTLSEEQGEQLAVAIAEMSRLPNP